jgi:hypothetical protein
MDMKLKYMAAALLALVVLTASAQWRYKYSRFPMNQQAVSDFVKNYSDSLSFYKARLDSIRAGQFSQSALYPQSLRNMYSDEALQISSSPLFMPVTFYRNPVRHALRLSSSEDGANLINSLVDNALINVYLNRPELVSMTESTLDQTGNDIISDPTIVSGIPDIVNKVAPNPVEPDIVPVDIVVKKPNFWTYNGDYYLQFLQNYVSSNWYKGGESNYSMVGSVALQANYNNKQKVKWDNKLELKLGYQTTKGDTIHRYKTSEDLIRYTGKLGLQASKKWYYTFQLIAYTQFTHGVKNNDVNIYSDFMSPFNLNVSLGMDYNVNWFKQRLTGTMHVAPLALNYRYVDRLSLSTRYGLDEGSHSLTDYGSEVTLDLTWKFSDMIKWKTRLYGYTTYKRAELEWENTLSFQFNRYISTNIFIYPRFDDGTARDDHHGYWQFKEYASLGFSYSI